MTPRHLFPSGCPKPDVMHIDAEGDLAIIWSTAERTITLYVNTDGSAFAIAIPRGEDPITAETCDGVDVVPSMLRWFAPTLRSWDQPCEPLPVRDVSPQEVLDRASRPHVLVCPATEGNRSSFRCSDCQALFTAKTSAEPTPTPEECDACQGKEYVESNVVHLCRAHHAQLVLGTTAKGTNRP